MSAKKTTIKDLADNPVQRLASCLVLDTSYSMNGKREDPKKPIDELNQAVSLYMKTISENSKTKEKVEIAIVTFGSSEFSATLSEHKQDPKKGVKKILDFGSVEDAEVPIFVAGGYTPMGEAVDLALDMLEKRKMEYKDTIGGYEQPWLVLMTDGYPYDYKSSMEHFGKYHGKSINNAATRSYELDKKKKLTVLPVAIGDEANVEILKKFSYTNNPVRINNLNFEEFFRFLSQSQADPDKGFIMGETPDLEEII